MRASEPIFVSTIPYYPNSAQQNSKEQFVTLNFYLSFYYNGLRQLQTIDNRTFKKNSTRYNKSILKICNASSVKRWVRDHRLISGVNSVEFHAAVAPATDLDTDLRADPCYVTKTII